MFFVAIFDDTLKLLCADRKIDTHIKAIQWDQVIT